LGLCYSGQPSHPITRRLQEIIREFKIPQEYFQELLRGVEMDLTHKRYATFEELYQYCYRVASVVGLICIEIFGYQDPRVKEHAIHQGLAFQLTNILRDVRVDSELGRIYLPQEDLKRFHYTEEDLFAHTYNPAFQALMHFEAERAKEYYRKAKALIPNQDRLALIASEIMGAIYYRLLMTIEKRGYNVFAEAIRLSSFHKMVIALWTWCRIKLDQSVA
jgi:phytoene synthase